MPVTSTISRFVTYRLSFHGFIDHICYNVLFSTNWTFLIKSAYTNTFKFNCPICYCCYGWCTILMNIVHFGIDLVVLQNQVYNHCMTFNFIRFQKFMKNKICDSGGAICCLGRLLFCTCYFIKIHSWR